MLPGALTPFPSVPAQVPELEDDSWADGVSRTVVSEATDGEAKRPKRELKQQRSGSRTPPARGTTMVDSDITLEARVAAFEEGLTRAVQTGAYNLVTKYAQLNGRLDVGLYATVHGVAGRPDLEGKSGIILGYDCNSERLVLEVNSDIVLIPKAALRTHR